MLLMVCNYEVRVNALRVRQIELESLFLIYDIRCCHGHGQVIRAAYVCDWDQCGTAKDTFFVGLYSIEPDEFTYYHQAFKMQMAYFITSCTARHPSLCLWLLLCLGIWLNSSPPQADLITVLFYVENEEFVIGIWILQLLPYITSSMPLLCLNV